MRLCKQWWWWAVRLDGLELYCLQRVAGKFKRLGEKTKKNVHADRLQAFVGVELKSQELHT